MDSSRKFEEWKQRICGNVRECIDLSREVPDDEIQDMIDNQIVGLGRSCGLTLIQRQELGKSVFHSIRKMDVIQELVDSDDITEIMINGTDNIFVEKAGCIYQWDKQFDTREKLEDVIQQIVAKCNRTVNEASPIVDARLENGARVNIVLAPVALNGPIVTIRRFPDKPILMKDLIGYGSITEEAAQELSRLVRAGYNIFISGGTGSGKTTFLNALSNYIPQTERVITIEDSAELQIRHIPNLVRLETRNANSSGTGGISMRDLIKSSLRMRPERIVVGEVRGEEALDMLQAMNTGHDGSISTGHANSAEDMISRLETMVLSGAGGLPLEAIRQQIASAVDIIIHLSRLRDSSRKTMSVSEVVGLKDGKVIMNPLFEFQEDEKTTVRKVSGSLKRTENEMVHPDKFIASGIYDYL